MIVYSKNVEIVTLGYSSMDHFICVNRFPDMGSKSPFYNSEIMGGGQAATAAVALSRWGANTRYIGRVGGDQTGQQSIDWLEENGVIADSALKTPGVTSQTAYILVPDDSGERTVIWRREPGLDLNSADLKTEWFNSASVLFVDGHELEASVTAAKWIKNKGGTVVLDAEHIGTRREELLSLVDIAVGSEDFGKREFKSKSHEDTIGILRKYGVKIAGVTLGKKGSILDWGEGIRNFRACEVNVVDTTGAGDIFHAALAYGALRKMGYKKMISFASVAASLSCRVLGGRSGIPALQEIEQRLEAEGEMEIIPC